MQSGTLYSAGVDWLTCTTTNPEVREAGLEAYNTWASTVAQLGVREQNARWLQFSGVSCGGFFCGGHESLTCLRLGSTAASACAISLLRDGWRASRLDAQLTVVLPDSVDGYARALSMRALASREGAHRGRPSKVMLMESFGHGDTLTLGSRSSAAYGRSYDKHRESKGEYPEGAWRFEVEYKAKLAQKAATALLGARDTTQQVLALVAGYWQKGGIQMPLDLTITPDVLTLERLEGSDERSLRWLSSTVAPTVARLIHNGKLRQVLSALGLDTYAREE